MKSCQPPFTSSVNFLAAVTLLFFGHFQAFAEPAAKPAPKRLSTVQFEHQVFLAELDKPIEALQKRYLELLTAEKTRLRKAGNPAAARMVREVIDSRGQGSIDFPQALAEASRLQAIFRQERDRMLQVRAEKVTALTKSYRAKLEKLRETALAQDLQAIVAELGAIDATLLSGENEPAGIPGMSGALAVKNGSKPRR